MQRIEIGSSVTIPELNESGIVCGYDAENSTYVVETEYGWISDVKPSSLEPTIPTRANLEHDSLKSYPAGI